MEGSTQWEGRQDALLAAIVDSTADAVISTDRTGRITSWNRGAQTVFGYSDAEAIGAHIELLHPDARSAALTLESVLDGRRIDHAEVLRIGKGGVERMVGETTSPVIDAGEVVGMATISRDITDRLVLAARLAEAHQELEADRRRLQELNAELQQFAYVASHDLSEPLRSVAGMVRLLERRYRGRLDSDADEFIDFAVSGCDRMRAMIDGLLAYSRVGNQALDVVAVDLGAVVAEVVESLRQQIDETGTAVEVGALPTVFGDRRQLHQLFQNLVSNAVKFRRPDVAPVVRVSASPAGPDRWRIAVADNGIGIEEQYRERIFTMFQRLHSYDRYEGTGIGLALAQRIVKRHGGEIDVVDNEDGGTTFGVVLPVEGETDGEPAADPDPAGRG